MLHMTLHVTYHMIHGYLILDSKADMDTFDTDYDTQYMTEKINNNVLKF